MGTLKRFFGRLLELLEGKLGVVECVGKEGRVAAKNFRA
jgi:hypothetical protein